MITAIIQARVGSTRLPNKIFADICGKPLIWHVVNRLTYSQKIEKILLATTVNPQDDVLETWATENNVLCFRGSETDVLDRYYKAAQNCGASVIVRITADDPFKDPLVIDDVIDALFERKVDFTCNNFPPSFPEGLDTEVFTFAALEKAATHSVDPFEREHVTQYFYRHEELFSRFNRAYPENASSLRWTIDTDKDLEMAKEVYKHLYQNGRIFLMQEILNLIREYPEIPEINQNVKRSHMYAVTK